MVDRLPGAQRQDEAAVVEDGPRPAVRRLLGQTVAVHDVGRAVEDFERLGLVCSARSPRPRSGLDVATFAFPNGSYLELVAPADPAKEAAASLEHHLAKHGEGTHLVRLEVDDLAETYGRLSEAGVPVAGPPRSAPESISADAEMLWLGSAATGNGLTQLVSFSGPGPTWSETTRGARLFTHVYAVRELASVAGAFTALGLQPWARYRTARWGLDTVVHKLADDSHIEVVAPTRADTSVAGVVAHAISERGEGHYMTVIEVDDVEALAATFESEGVPVLGPPSQAPPEGPWGPCRQLWVHPRLTHGCFLEFLTLPGGAAT